MNTPTFDGATWRKSSYSGQNGTCVEIAGIGSLVGVRDSKNIDTGHLTCATAEWQAFVGAVKGGQFTH